MTHDGVRSRPGEDSSAAIERLIEMLDTLPQMVWSNDADGGHYYNNRWLEFTGTPLGREVERRDLVHPDDVSRAMAAWDEAQRTGAYETAYRLRHHSGEYRWVISQGIPKRGEDGTIVGWYGTCTDVHERFQSMDALRRSEALTRTILATCPDPVFLLNNSGEIVFVNEATLAEIGAESAAATLGQKWFSAFPGTTSAKPREALALALGGQRSRFPLVYPDPAGRQKSWDVYVSPVTNYRGEVVNILVVCRDITEAAEASARVEELQRELLHVSRISAMGTMAATLAHELNQPLTAACNYLAGARRIAARSDANEDLQHALKEAESQVQRSGDIIRRIRAGVSGGQAAPQTASLSALAGNAVKLLAVSQVCNSQFIRVEIAEEADRVEVDPIQTEQVLVNLLRNACEAFAGGGRPEIVVTAEARPEAVEVQVRDSGRGLRPGEEEWLFTSRGSLKGDGMGLGLSISRTIVENQGGRIWATRNRGGGATFHFTLPRPGV
ncbi:MAG TPA: PAS domain-containing protein, partial [Allosphingosinicella sp.]|nr:PAS domain-containing protein [Allosphingosinicella sp.]